MIDDVRYSELPFLKALEMRLSAFEYFRPTDERQTKHVCLDSNMYVEMAAALIEDLYVRFDNDTTQLIVSKLRGELSPSHGIPNTINEYDWSNPRRAFPYILTGQFAQRLHITYRGRRRIQELPELLKRDRILDPSGVLLSIQYFRADLQEAIARAADVAASVLYLDMDDFGPINKKCGQVAGDVVIKAYLEVVRDTVGLLGTGYRGSGDEVVALILGQSHQRACELAEEIRKGVEALHCEHKGQKLPKVTVSIGVATAPPDARTMDLEGLADFRKFLAKDNGKNRAVSG
jgi:diguanylate cyclase (GGDEF)-like protein